MTQDKQPEENPRQTRQIYQQQQHQWRDEEEWEGQKQRRPPTSGAEQPSPGN